jgi:hypothetical protein
MQRHEILGKKTNIHGQADVAHFSPMPIGKSLTCGSRGCNGRKHMVAAQLCWPEVVHRQNGEKCHLSECWGQELIFHGQTKVAALSFSNTGKSLMSGSSLKNGQNHPISALLPQRWGAVLPHKNFAMQCSNE